MHPFCPIHIQAVVPELPPRSPHFVRVVHTTGGRPLIGHGVLTVNNSLMTVLVTLVTVKQPPLALTHLQRNVQYLNSPYVTILYRKTN